MNDWTFIISVLALAFSFLTAGFSILAYANVIGLRNSTHKIQWMPMQEQGPTGEELADKMRKMYGEDPLY